MFEELDDILLHRPLHSLATARDLPRLLRNITLQMRGTTVFDGSGGGTVLEMCRTLNQICGSKHVVEEKKDTKAMILEYGQSMGPLTADAFVYRCLNQNIIASPVIRIKYALQENGLSTKDDYWRILVNVVGEEVEVTHTKQEKDTGGKFEFVWKLVVRRGGQHELCLESMSKETPDNVRQVLEQCVAKANRRDFVIELPNVKTYMDPNYFW
jgi:hypothetical protein